MTDLEFDVEAWVPGTANRQATDPAWFRTLQLSVPRLGLEEWELLLGVNVMSEPMGQALADALVLVGRTGYQLRGASVSPKPDYEIPELVAAIQSDDLTSSYHAETLRALRQRLGALSGTGLFSAAGTSIDQLPELVVSR